MVVVLGRVLGDGRFGTVFTLGGKPTFYTRWLEMVWHQKTTQKNIIQIERESESIKKEKMCVLIIPVVGSFIWRVPKPRGSSGSSLSLALSSVKD